MNAGEIIEQIKRLPLSEQEHVVRFARTFNPLEWTPEQLDEAAALLVAEKDSAKAADLKKRIIAGFYGDA